MTTAFLSDCKALMSRKYCNVQPKHILPEPTELLKKKKKMHWVLLMKYYRSFLFPPFWINAFFLGESYGTHGCTIEMKCHAFFYIYTFIDFFGKLCNGTSWKYVTIVLEYHTHIFSAWYAYFFFTYSMHIFYLLINTFLWYIELHIILVELRIGVYG